MEQSKRTNLSKNKLFGAFLMLIGIFGCLVIIHRLSYYVFEYDTKFSVCDYGRFNILSFFTVQSNIFVCAYLILTSLAVFGNKKAEKIAFNPTVGALVTTYIIVTGVVYCCGIPLGFTPPFKWDTATHAMSSFIQVFHHMLIPPLMTILWFFPLTDKKISYKKLWIFGIYPLAYSIFSIIRGAVSIPVFYPYPFYRPEFIWDLFLKGKEMNVFSAYLLMLPVLIVGISIFILLGAVLIAIHNKRTKGIKNVQKIKEPVSTNQ